MEVEVIKIICKRCGHKWSPRVKDVRLCPNCHSPWWDTEKGKTNIK